MKLHPTPQRIQDTLRKMAAAHAAAMAASEEAMSLLAAEFAEISQPTTRSVPEQSLSSDTPIIDRPMLSVAYQGRSCFLGNTLPLRLLERLLRRPNHYVHYNQLQDDVWHSDPSPESVRSVVKELRRKLRGAGMQKLAKAIDGRVAKHYCLNLAAIS